MKKRKLKLWYCKIKKTALSIIASLMILISYAQDGNAGINEANSKVKSYFASGISQHKLHFAFL